MQMLTEPPIPPAWQVGAAIASIAVVVGALSAVLKRGLRTTRLATSPWADFVVTAGTLAWGAALAALPGVFPEAFYTRSFTGLRLLLGALGGAVSATAFHGARQAARGLGPGAASALLGLLSGGSVGPSIARTAAVEDDGRGR
jgi:hypothetical protein